MEKIAREEEGEIVIEITSRRLNEMRKFLRREKLKSTQIDTIILLVKVSNGRRCFETTLEGLAEKLVPGYKTLETKEKRRHKSIVRRRLDYFVDEKQKYNSLYFEVLSKKCAVGCAASHSKEHPNPDTIKIQLNFLTEWDRNKERETEKSNFQQSYTSPSSNPTYQPKIS